jgi:uncharacterized protein YndB with AHSA1/START domain
MNTSITVQYKINAPVEKVWKALTDKDEMKSWYFDIQDFEPTVGKVFNFYEPGEKTNTITRVRFWILFPIKKIKHTWSYPDFSDQKTTVVWELQPENGGALVKLTHEDIENFKDLEKDFQEKILQAAGTQLLGKV